MGIKICRCSLALFFRLRGDVRSYMVITILGVLSLRS